jgi:hypothetical protein
MRRRLIALGVLAAAMALAGCTYVPTDAQPHVVNGHSVPFNLLHRPAGH